MVSALAEEYSTEVTFIKADIDEPQGEELAAEMGVRYIPAFFFINTEGEVVEQLGGEQSKDSLRTGIEQIME